ncbi:MAG: cyclic nucleotide-binding domain-containing protein [Spirochaetaceae bacterium]|jgi:CRP-like cAMP-binding protein|nr:cyclic nucleotide-binding domain-containing protein [Spirochaetaceae bacterium]
MESSVLQKYSLFGGLLTEQIEGILPLLDEESYEEGAEIISEGNPNDKIRFILEGRVAVLKQGIVLYEFSEGEAFGEMEVLDVMRSVATIKALTPLRVMSISNRALREIYKIDLKTFSLLIMNLARDLSRRLRHMDERIMKDHSMP